MLRHLFLAAGHVLASASTAAWPSPERVVASFYDHFIHSRAGERGLPYFRRVEAVLGPELLAAMRAQHDYEKACTRLAGPGVKPYMIDANPFYGSADNARALLSTRMRTTGGMAKVAAQLDYGDGYTQVATVVLRKDSGGWVIVEIQWDDGRTLTKALVDFAAERCVA